MAKTGIVDGRARIAVVGGNEEARRQQSDYFAGRKKPWLTDAAKSTSLTSREEQVMSGLAEGLLYKEISDALRISFGTVNKNCNNIYRKFQVNNRTEAVRVWLRRGGR